jgi:DNA-binding MarR family transcriptional regulator
MARRPDPTSAENVYRFICNFKAEHGHTPTMRQIADACFLSLSGVGRCLNKLEAWGRITREPNQRRTISLVEDEEN